jgi:hypothetical protein
VTGGVPSYLYPALLAATLGCTLVPIAVLEGHRRVVSVILWVVIVLLVLALVMLLIGGHI